MTWTSLHDACVHQDSENIVRVAKAHPEAAVEVDEHGWTPLHILCLGSPDTQALKALLEACPQTVSDQDAFGNTPLHVACSHPQAEKHVVQLLLKEGPTTASIVNHEGLMPLHMACRYAPKNAGVIGLLIESHPYALRSHIKMGDTVPLKGSDNAGDSLAKRKPMDHVPLDQSGGMASKPSVDLRYNGTTKQVRDGAYPLHMAVEAYASLDIIEMMIKEADEILLKTNKFGETPLQIALKHKVDDEVVEVILKSAPEALYMSDNVKENTPIHTAAMVGCSSRTAKTLLETWQESIHQTNAEGLTPLDLAISGGACDEDVLRLFVISDETT